LADANPPDPLLAYAGRTPDYWEQDQNFCNWPAPYLPVGKDATLFNSEFSGTTGYHGKTLLDVLKMGNSTAVRDVVARHMVAALLNASAGLTQPHLLSVTRVFDMWSWFDRLGYVEPTVGIRWYADSASVPGTGSIIQWLKSTMSA
jgi:hypothetical protein